MKIETDYIKREAQKECYWLQGGTFDLVTWTQAMMQNAADRAGSKIRQLEVALRIKTEKHDCCAADLIHWRKSAEAAIGENVDLRGALNEILCLDTGRLGDAYVIAGLSLSQKPSTTESNAPDAPVTEPSHQPTETNEQRKG